MNTLTNHGNCCDDLRSTRHEVRNTPNLFSQLLRVWLNRPSGCEVIARLMHDQPVAESR